MTLLDMRCNLDGEEKSELGDVSPPCSSNALAKAAAPGRASSTVLQARGRLFSPSAAKPLSLSFADRWPVIYIAVAAVENPIRFVRAWCYGGKSSHDIVRGGTVEQGVERGGNT